jgi:hypothetical protein
VSAHAPVRSACLHPTGKAPPSFRKVSKYMRIAALFGIHSRFCRGGRVELERTRPTESSGDPSRGNVGRGASGAWRDERFGGRGPEPEVLLGGVSAVGGAGPFRMHRRAPADLRVDRRAPAESAGGPAGSGGSAGGASGSGGAKRRNSSGVGVDGRGSRLRTEAAVPTIGVDGGSGALCKRWRRRSPRMSRSTVSSPNNVIHWLWGALRLGAGNLNDPAKRPPIIALVDDQGRRADAPSASGTGMDSWFAKAAARYGVSVWMDALGHGSRAVLPGGPRHGHPKTNPQWLQGQSAVLTPTAKNFGEHHSSVGYQNAKSPGCADLRPVSAENEPDSCG